MVSGRQSSSTTSGIPRTANIPLGGVILDGSGNLYGTTSQGGTQECSDDYNVFGCGTVFELSPNNSGGEWTETILYNFRSNAIDDGYFPNAGLVMDSSGNLYGTTQYGGRPYTTPPSLTDLALCAGFSSHAHMARCSSASLE
jgi:hypothetical protein